MVLEKPSFLNSNKSDILIENNVVIKKAIKINKTFLNKNLFTMLLSMIFKFIASNKEIIKFTNPEANTIPLIPKLKEKIFPKLIIGPPIKIQSNAMFNPIPMRDKLKGNLIFSNA